MRSTTCFLACLLISAMPAVASAAGADAADAAQRNDIAALRAMVTKRVNVNTAQADGTTALHWAAHWNDVEAVTLLLRAGANAATTNRFGASPLSEAAISGNAVLVKALL
ncbi:MAG TPA: ankyrin repeat domain-containing protein, partial [Vicinamibacterales bacterium]